MAVELTYNSSAMIKEIVEDKISRLTAQRPWNDFFPITTLDADELLWEQWENVTGVMQGRGLEAPSPFVKPQGLIRFRDTPGYYGEHIDITESEIVRMRQPGSFGTPIDITTLITKRQDQLLLRYLDRVELNIWNLIINGTISVPAATGAIIDSRSYLRQTFTSSVNWSVAATSTPLADFRAVKLLSRGHSVDFGSGSTAYMNQTTANQLLVNTNAADLYGRRTAGLGTFNNMDEVNQLLLGDDLPKIQVYDETYLADGSVNAQATDFTQYGSPTLFIPTGTVILIGRRTNNEPVGNFHETKNAQNPGNAPGPYMFVADNIDSFDRVPRKVAVHHGYNGFACLFFPSAVCVMTVN